jgi:hypothetical protein
VLLGAAVLEGLLRLFWDDYYVRQPREHLEFHPTRGWANKAGVRVEYGNPEYRVMVGHGSLGFRGGGFRREKTPGKVRVLALGDSMTYGLGVEDDETYSAVLEKLDPRLEVVNAGVAGYSTAEELLLLREQGLRLAPDVVLVAFLWNDLKEAYKGMYGRFTLQDGVLRFTPAPSGSPAPPMLKPKRVRHPILSRSYLYRFASDRVKVLRYWLSPRELALFLSGGELEEAWSLVLALLREIAALAQAHGAKFLLVVIPDQVQVEPDARVVGLDPAVFGVQERLRAFGQSEGVAVLDLLPGLAERYGRDGEKLHHRYDRHWTPVGHRAAAELILAELDRLGFLDTTGDGSHAAEPLVRRGGSGP